MGLTITAPPGPVDQVMRSVSDATVEGSGCARITPQEYAALQADVGALAAPDRATFDKLVHGDSPSSGLYGSVIQSLVRGDSYDQFVQGLRPGMNASSAGTCALTS